MGLSSATVIEVRKFVLEKAFSPISSREAGSEIDSRELCAKALSPIFLTPSLRIMDLIPLDAKARLPIDVTTSGSSIDFKDAQPSNAEFGIPLTLLERVILSRDGSR